MDKVPTFLYAVIVLAVLLFAVWFWHKSKEYLAKKIATLNYHSSLVQELEHELGYQHAMS